MCPHDISHTRSLNYFSNDPSVKFLRFTSFRIAKYCKEETWFQVHWILKYPLSDPMKLNQSISIPYEFLLEHFISVTCLEIFHGEGDRQSSVSRRERGCKKKVLEFTRNNSFSKIRGLSPSRLVNHSNVSRFIIYNWWYF